MNKVVCNTCYGGFELSNAAIKWLKEKYKLTVGEIDELPRHDPRLVECVEKLGKMASGICSEISICNIEGNEYIIDEYDGAETVVEPKDIHWIKI